MRDYFLHLFQYNDWANQLILQAISDLEEPDEALYRFTHLILCQENWMRRVRGESTTGLSWLGPIYPFDQCEQEWMTSLQVWLDFLETAQEEDLARVVEYQSTEGPKFSSTLQEIVVQLNNHSVHHRAQIARLVRQQGQVPPQTDYIFYTRRREE